MTSESEEAEWSPRGRGPPRAAANGKTARPEVSGVQSTSSSRAVFSNAVPLQGVGSITVGSGGNQTSVPLTWRGQLRNTLPWTEASMSSTLFQWRGENGPAASGSPVFICPNGCNNNPEIIGLVASYKSWPQVYRFRGPRVEQFSNFVSANAP